jgi:protease-4
VKTGKFADGLLTVSRPRTDEELAVFQRGVDWMYSQFVAKVAEGRNLPPSRVEEIAQGRVWSGTEALKIGLVDEIGGLDAAIRYAGRQGNLGEHFRVTEYPKSKNLSQAIAEMFGKFAPTSLHLSSTGLVGQITEQFESQLSWLNALNDPKGVYARMPVNLLIR